jgi:hypothetical protein
MADSEISRTLPSNARRKSSSNQDEQADPAPAITRRNLLNVTAKILTSRTTELRKLASGQQPGRKSAAQLWQEWYVVHQRCERVTRLQQKLETQVLAMAGSFPIAEISIPGQSGSASVGSFAEIKRLNSQLNPDQLKEARSQLRNRRMKWKAADEKVGFSAALALERDLSEQEGIWARELWLAHPISLVEVIAKLHCVIEMEDPGIKLKEAPWPQLRTILGNLIQIEKTLRDEAR